MYAAVSRQTAPTRRRAIVAAAIGLGLTTALAASLVQAKRTDFPVSFQPPPDWSKLAQGRNYIAFHDISDSDNPRQLILRVITRPPGVSATEVALLVMSDHLARFASAASPVAAEEASLGFLPGARVNMPDTGDYVHVGLLPGDTGEAVILRYHTDQPFSERDIQTYRQVADSIKVAGGR